MDDALKTVAEGLRRLPKVVADIEKSASVIAGGGLKIDPKSVLGAIGSQKPRFQITSRIYLLVIAALILLLILI